MSHFVISILTCIFLLGCTDEGPIILSGNSDADKVKILIGGSESVLPVMRELVDGFTSYSDGYIIDFGAPGHTGAGIKAVQNGSYTIGAISRPLKPSEKEYGLREFWFAEDALVFCTHPETRLSNITSEQVKAVYSGKINSWSELGGADHKIVVLDRPADSSPNRLLVKMGMLKGQAGRLPSSVVLRRPADMDMSLLSSPYSIGYTSFSSVRSNDFDSINVLMLNGIEPSIENVKNRTYQLFRAQGFVIREENVEEAGEFIDFIFGTRGAKLLTDNGLVPLGRGK